VRGKRHRLDRGGGGAQSNHACPEKVSGEKEDDESAAQGRAVGNDESLPGAEGVTGQHDKCRVEREWWDGGEEDEEACQSDTEGGVNREGNARRAPPI
jgi:hypothetical protein